MWLIRGKVKHCAEFIERQYGNCDLKEEICQRYSGWGRTKRRKKKTFQEFPQILINRSNSLAQEIASYQKGLQVPANDWVVNNVVQNKKVLESSNILDTHQLIVPFLTKP